MPQAIESEKLLTLYDVGEKGLGVISTVILQPKTLIGVFLGRISNECYSNQLSVTLNINSGTKDSYLYINPNPSGNIFQFLNHSCDANCEFQLVEFNGLCYTLIKTRKK